MTPTPEEVAPSISTSVIRTLTVLIVGWLASVAVKAGIPVDSLDAPITLLVTVSWYAGVRWLETHVDPAFGWLLGSAKAPQYEVKK